jgi:RHS repeat-associated protein
MRRIAIVVLVAAILLVLPGSKLEFPPHTPIALADPALSGAITTDVVNGDFSGAGLGEVGTPPANNDFETAGGAVGAPPSNNGFGTGDFTDWTPTGTPTIQTGGPNGDYARVDSSEDLKTAAFTVASNAQSITWQMAAVNAGTFQVIYRIWYGAGHTSGGTAKFITACPTTCTNWNTYSIDAVEWRGQSIKLEVERYLGDLKLDEVAVQMEAVPSWEPSSAGGHRISRETGGPGGAYVKTTTTSVTSQAYTLSADAQQAEIDLKVDSASGSYDIYVLSGATYATSTKVFSGTQANSSTWGTKSFGIGDFAGQSVKFKVTPSSGATILFDDAAVSKNVLRGWTGRVSAVTDVNGVTAVTGHDILSTPLHVDYDPAGKAWFKVCYDLYDNFAPGSGASWGSTIEIWAGSLKVFQDGSFIDMHDEQMFLVPSSVGGTVQFKVRLSWDDRFDAWDQNATMSCLERVDGPGQVKVLGNPDVGSRNVLPPGLNAYIVGDSSDDPVDLVSGNYFQAHTDLAVPGKGIPLTWTRTYSAQAYGSSGGQSSVMGAKWSHNWQAALTEFDSGNAVAIALPAGATQHWRKVSGVFQPSNGVRGTLVKHVGGDWTLTTHHQLVYAFDSAGKWTSVTDRNGNTTSLTYNGSGQLTTITEPGGRSLTLTYTSGRITSVSDGLGRSVSYTYDGNGDLVTITDVMGNDVDYVYEGHLLVQGTDAKGNVFVRNTYDSKNRVTEQLDALDGVTTIAYDTPGAGATRVTDQRGKQTTYYFDQQMRITDVMDDNGGVTTKTYDSKNNVLTVTNPLGKTWEYTYDSKGNVLTAEDPLGKVWEYTYNSDNDVLTVEDPLANVTTYGYDGDGNLTSVTDANNEVTTFTVNGDGLVTEVEDPLTHTTTFDYDSYGNRTEVTNALSKTWTYAYDTKGRVTSVTDPLSHATTFTYNDANLVLTATNALSKTTTYTYDNNGNVLTVTDANSNVTTYTYDDKDQLQTITDAEAGVWNFNYDEVGNLTSKVNPRGKTTTYTYDDLNRLVEESDPLSHERSYAYDAAGRLTSRTNAELDQIDYTYNDRNELTRIDYPDLSFVSFAYNDAGARTQMVDGTGTTTYAYDDLYRLTSVTFPGSRTVSYAYDDAGRRTSMTYPGGSDQVTYGYDNANRLTSVTDWNSNAIAYAYDDAGRLTAKTLPSGTGIVSSYTYDTADRLTGISHVKGGSTTIASVTYTLDDVGNRTQRVDQAGTHTYAYDDLYRLTSVTYPGPSTTTYDFDAFGNRESMTVGSDETTYTYDDADRLTEVDPPAASPIAYTWDDNGSLTNRGADTFAWDYEERMTAATVNSVTTTFAYRGDGLRHSRTTGANTTTFTWDIAAGLPVVIDDGAQYVYGAGLESQTNGANTYYYLADGLGSTMAIVDDTGTVQKSYTYDVYGDATATGSLANEFDFAGQQTDPTGLQYLRARYMDPETGVFLSREPLAKRPSWTQTSYGYAGGSPSSAVDPTGLIKWPWQCMVDWLGLVNAVTELMARAAEWYVGKNGTWDFINHRPTSPAFQDGHRAAFENYKVNLSKWKSEWWSDGCGGGPKPPHYKDYMRVSEYLLRQDIDEAADDIANAALWTQGKIWDDIWYDIGCVMDASPPVGSGGSW